LEITQEQFDSLLAWLDPDRECAGSKYENIRAGLLRIFVSKGFNDAEDLVDDSINRVITRLPDIKDNYYGEPAHYFRGVARNVIRETGRRKEVLAEAAPVSVDTETVEDDEFECLDACLELLPEKKREFILSYYVHEGHDKIEDHKRMAKELGITKNALRGRAHHLRSGLEQCMKQCLQRRAKTKQGQKSS